MSRIIKPENGVSYRNKLLKSIAVTVLALTSKVDVDDETRDMLSFIILCLQKINESIDLSVNAWEKRGYWLKSDRFRLEWEWVQVIEKELKDALFTENWPIIPSLLSDIFTKVSFLKTSNTKKKTELWLGAYKFIKNEK